MWACKTCTRMHKHSTRVHTHVHAHTLMHAPSTRVHAQNTHARTHTQPHASWPPRWQGRWLLGGEGLFPSHRSQTVPTTTPPAHARCGQRARRSYMCKVLIWCRSRKRYKTLAVSTIVPRNHAVPALPRVLPRPQLLMFQLFYDLTVFPPDRPNSNTIAFTIHWFLVYSWSRATSTRI